MEVTVRYFASARELAGCQHERLDLEGDATIATLQGAIGRRHPHLVDLMKRSRFAVGHAYVTAEHALQPGDDVALIPPVSGG